MAAKKSTRRTEILVCVALFVVTLVVFWGVTANEFISFDDDEYITANPQVQAGLTGESVAWAFANYHSNNWHPLTWLVHMTDQELFGEDAGGHHLTSLLFHALNALLLFLVLYRLTGSLGSSALVAALFALHPAHVESVAWAAEKKDVISTLFAILTIGAYARYVRSASAGRYALALGLFALGLLAKPMLVTLPFVLLLLDYWPLGRCCGEPPASRPWSTLLLEKVPFLVLAAASSWVTLLAQQSGGVLKTLESFPLGTRLANAIVAYAAYLGKLVWPSKLAILYPHPHEFPFWQVGGAALLLAAITAAVFVMRRRQPALIVGWLWFLGTLVPVIGLVQVGNQAFADRYTYLPYIGLFVAIVWTLRSLLDRKVVVVAVVVVLSTLGVRTWYQTRHWKDTITLFRHTVAVTQNNYLIHDNLGNLLAGEGHLDEALEQYREAVRIRPAFTQGHYNAGVALSKAARYEEAVPYFDEAVRQQPDFVKAHFNLAVCHARLNQAEPAIRHFEEVLRINPDNAQAHRNLGGILRALGRNEDAEVHLGAADRLERKGPR